MCIRDRVYTADASFGKKNTKTAVIKSNKTTVKEIKGLKPGKKYYVKVRTYKMCIRDSRYIERMNFLSEKYAGMERVMVQKTPAGTSAAGGENRKESTGSGVFQAVLKGNKDVYKRQD